MKQTKASSITHTQDDFSFITQHEKQFILLIILFAAFRVFIFSAIFPFFNNVDEVHHYDTVVKYARGYIPQKQNNLFDYESSRIITLYGSPEFFYTSSEIKNNGYFPLWRITQFVSSDTLNQIVSSRMQNKNIEAFSPPIYYAVMGVWYNIGKWIGMTGGFGLYWIRFANVIVFILLLIVTNKFCRLIAPQNLSLRYGVILLLAGFPQDVFYSIGSDVFSPLFFLLALLSLIKIYLSKKGSLFYFITGLLIAATFLVKLTNIIIFVTMFFILINKLIEYQRNKNFKEGIYHVGLCLTGAFIPVAIWIITNSFTIGDPLGTTEKVKGLGWTLKPFYQWFNHPLFTFRGLSTFIADLLKSFWRGEFVWGMQIIASNVVDNIYVILTILFLTISVFNVVVRKKSSLSLDRYEYMILFLSIIGSVFMLGMLSIMYDFGNCWCPSREYPYFTVGRLILGTLVPVLILFVDGLQSILTFFHQQKYTLWIILALVLFITASEISISLPAFMSLYNFFHLY